ncbi:PAK-2p27 [Dactylella cylindrospora]|nr:PAK-2p27 [Dactylella cylindrospora]
MAKMHQSSDEYEKRDLVGKGSFGFVYKALHKPTRQIVAVKILSLDVAEQELVDVQQEIALLSQLNAAEGVNVTKYYGAFMKGPQLWIIMDYCSGGSVRTLMKPGRISEKYLTVIVRETVTALAFIHKFGVIHRDVKAANILVANDGRVQLCDFGVSALVQNPQTKRTTFVGTPWWMAPEVILENQTYNYKADIWSLGITILEIANGHPPYHDQEPMRALLMIPRQPPSRLEGGDWSQALRDFVSYCLCEMPEDRLPAEELLKQKLIKSVSRTPTSILRELVLRLEQWQKMGNVRNSLISGPNGLEILEGIGNKDDEITWDFDENPVESTPAYSKGHVVKDSLTSFLSLDSNETVKAAPPPAPKPIHTGTDHPLLQLFAIDNQPGHGGVVNQTPVALQPAFQPAPSINNNRPPGPSYKSPASTRPASPEPLMTIDLPSFDDDSGELVAPGGMSPPPLTQIELPSDESFLTMRNTATPLSQAGVIPSEPPAPPMLTPAGASRSDKLSSGRALRSERGAHMASKSADIPPSQFGQGPISPSKKLPAPPPPQTPEESKRPEVMPVSAPSSPPRSRAKFSHAMPASSISNSNAINAASGRKAHHLPSLSAPQVSYREGVMADPVPPVPSIADATKNRSAESTPLSSKPRMGVDQDQKPPVPTVVTSALTATPPAGPTSTSTRETPRGAGFKRADLSLKLPANPHHGIEIANNSQFPHSPGGRFLSPFANNSAFGSQTPTPTAASHAQSFNLPVSVQQQHQVVQMDPWGMPLNVTLNPTALFPSASNEDVHTELTRMLALLDTSLSVFATGLKQYQNQIKGQPGPVSTTSVPVTPPITIKRVKKARRPQDPKQSDTEGFVSESN